MSSPKMWRWSFGEYFQEVMHYLVMNHKWDDPYASITPMFDPEGRWLNRVFDAYNECTDTKLVAFLIHCERFREDD